MQYNFCVTFVTTFLLIIIIYFFFWPGGLVYAYLSYIRNEKYCPATTTPAAALYVTTGYPLPPGFVNGVDWRALAKD